MSQRSTVFTIGMFAAFVPCRGPPSVAHSVFDGDNIVSDTDLRESARRLD